MSSLSIGSRPRDATTKRWRVELDSGEAEQVEASDAEITASGALVFYRSASRVERERTLLSAFSPNLWRRCELESTN